MSDYRPCVIAVIQDDRGLILAGERADYPGSWQLPQGGIEAGEEPLNALFRELQEELGANSVTIEKKLPKRITYDFPNDLKDKMKTNYKGQAQCWFLAKPNHDFCPNLEASDGEFRAYKWITAEVLLEGIVSWKKDAYQQGLRSLGVLEGVV